LRYPYFVAVGFVGFVKVVKVVKVVRQVKVALEINFESLLNYYQDFPGFEVEVLLNLNYITGWQRLPVVGLVSLEIY
jgi:hypothetical protein